MKRYFLCTIFCFPLISAVAPPIADSVSPNAGTGASQVFTLRYTSANGPGYLVNVDAMFNSTLSGANACLVRYDQPSRGIYLYTDIPGNGGTGPLVVGADGSIGRADASGLKGGEGSLSNGQCTLDGTGSSVMGSGNTLTMVLNMSFKTGFSGAKNIFLSAADNGGLDSGWQTRGSWIVPQSTIVASESQSTGKTLTAADNLQAAINAAKGGDTITLKAGDKWTGNFTLPVRKDQGVVAIQTSGTLPAVGIRLDPDKQAGQLATIMTPQELPALAFQPSTSGWSFRGVEITATTASKLTYNFVTMGMDFPKVASDQPSNITFEQVWIHGHTDRDYTTNFVRGIWAGASKLTVKDSVINYLTSTFMESGCIAADTAVGNILIQNNHLECAGDNVMFGTNQLLPQGWVVDGVTIRGNLIDKDMAWHDDPKASGVIVKNLTEFKNGKNIIEDSNVFLNSFQRNQNGYAALFTPRTINCTMPWNNVSNVAFTNNIVRHAVGGVIWAKWDSNRGTCTTDQITPSVNGTFRNNLFDDLSSKYAGNTSDQTNVIAFSVFSPDTVTIDRNTVTSGSYGQYLNNETCTIAPSSEVFTNNVITAPNPIWANCTGGPDALPPTTVFTGNYFPKMSMPQFVIDLWLKAYRDIAKPKRAGADLVKLAAIEAAVMAGTPLP